MGHEAKPVVLIAPPDQTGGKNGIQQIKSTITYLKRETVFSTLGLSSADAAENYDDDGRGAAPEQTPEAVVLLSEQQESVLVDMLAKVDEKAPGFTKHWTEYYISKYGASDSPLGIVIKASMFEGAKADIEKRSQVAFAKAAERAKTAEATEREQSEPLKNQAADEEIVDVNEVM